MNFLEFIVFRLVSVLTASILLAACSDEPPAVAKPLPAKATPVKVQPLAPSAPEPKVLTGGQVHDHLLKQFDRDQDGKVSMREVLLHAVDQQLSVDMDKNRTLSAQEFHMGLKDFSMQDPYIREAFKRIDKDKNGQLDERELASHAWAGIVHLDINQDGILSADEARAASGK